MAIEPGKTPMAGGLIYHFSHVRRWQGQSTPARASVVKSLLGEWSYTAGIQKAGNLHVQSGPGGWVPSVCFFKHLLTERLVIIDDWEMSLVTYRDICDVNVAHTKIIILTNWSHSPIWLKLVKRTAKNRLSSHIQTTFREGPPASHRPLSTSHPIIELLLLHSPWPLMFLFTHPLISSTFPFPFSIPQHSCILILSLPDAWFYTYITTFICHIILNQIQNRQKIKKKYIK